MREIELSNNEASNFEKFDRVIIVREVGDEDVCNASDTVSLVTTMKYKNRKTGEVIDRLECYGEGLVRDSWCKALSRVNVVDIMGTGTPLPKGVDEWTDPPESWASAWRDCFSGNEVVLMEVWKR